MNTKVYCSECGYCRSQNTTTGGAPDCNCIHPSNLRHEDTFYKQYAIQIARLQNLNKDNDCKNYKPFSNTTIGGPYKWNTENLPSGVGVTAIGVKVLNKMPDLDTKLEMEQIDTEIQELLARKAAL